MNDISNEALVKAQQACVADIVARMYYATELEKCEALFAEGWTICRGLAEPDIARLEHWVRDLQSGMYLNCAYCGQRYGPDGAIPVKAEVLTAHVEVCPEHPMAKLKVENEELRKKVTELELEVESLENSLLEANTRSEE